MTPASFATLRRFTKQRTPQKIASERCELCSVVLPAAHRHLLEMTNRHIACACDPCALLFENVQGGRFKLIPRDARSLSAFRVTDGEWEGLGLPINLAFISHSTLHGKMLALYPSPAGATEAFLPSVAWEGLTATNPVLLQLAPDVEALLVNRVAAAREYYLAPIDVCFGLVGLIRTHWRGLHGGDAVWQEIEGFFARLKTEAQPVADAEDHHADLSFQITGVESVTHGLTPLLHFRLAVTSTPPGEVIHSVILQAQIQILSPQRAYSAAEKEKLFDLFGTPDQWGQTLRNRLWAQTNATFNRCAASTEVILPVQCTCDLNITATKYFSALEDGVVPLLFLFSGTIFYAAPDGRLQVQQIPWHKECTYQMPIQVWQEMMDHHYPNSAWLCLQRDVFERLHSFKRRHCLPTWEQTIERLLQSHEHRSTEDSTKSEPLSLREYNAAQSGISLPL